MYPIQYLIKRIRINSGKVDAKDAQILDLFIKNNIKCEKPDEKIALQRQIARSYSTRRLHYPEDLIKHIMPLIDKQDVDLLKFRDRKGNNAFHLLTKHIDENLKNSMMRFIHEDIKKFIPESYT